MTTSTLEHRATTAIDHYFNNLLPRYLTAYLTGQGHTLVAQMMAAHDARDLAGPVAGVTASKRSLKLAARVRAQCPAVFAVGGLEHGVLGLFTKQASSISGEMLGSYREVNASWQVNLFLDTFVAHVPPEAWDAELLQTVFHEYIHYFESFLLRSEQPLRSREEGHFGVGEGPLSVADAARRDRRSVRRKRALWSVAGVLVLGLVVLMLRPTFDDDHRVARTAQRVKQLEDRVAALEGLLARRAEIEAAGAALAAQLTALSATDPSFDEPRAPALMRAACPDAEVTDMAGLMLVGRGARAQAVRCVKAVAAALPNLQAVGFTWRRHGWRLLTRPPIHPAALETHVDAAPKPPMFESARGTALRARYAELSASVRRLQAEALDLRTIEARRAAFAARDVESMRRLARWIGAVVPTVPADADLSVMNDGGAFRLAR